MDDNISNQNNRPEEECVPEIEGDVISVIKNDSDKIETELPNKSSKSNNVLLGPKDWENGMYEYYHDGFLNFRCYHLNGKLEGVYEMFENSNTLVELRHYLKGKLNGRFEHYNFNRIVMSCHYLDDKLNGRLERYKDGDITMSCNYVNGKLDGRFERYDKDGIKMSCHYLNGKLDGRHEIYSDQNILSTKYYQVGKLNGIWTTFSESGYVRTTREYKDDKPHGTFIRFSSDGNLESSQCFIDGVLIIGSSNQETEADHGAI